MIIIQLVLCQLLDLLDRTSGTPMIQPALFQTWYNMTPPPFLKINFPVIDSVISDVTNGPHDEGETKHCQRNVSVCDLAQGSPRQDVVWHHLLHGNTHSCNRKFVNHLSDTCKEECNTNLLGNQKVHECGLQIEAQC